MKTWNQCVCFLTVAFPWLAAAEEPVAVLDLKQAQVAGQTAVWSPLFQAGWDKLNGLHGGKPYKVEPENTLITQLDNFKWKEKEVMPAGAYDVYSGSATEKFAAEVQVKVFKKYGVHMPAKVSRNVSGQGLAVFGVMLRDANFKEAFFRSKKERLRFTDGEGKTRKVQFFGTLGSVSGGYGNSVEVLAQGENHGMLSVVTKQPDERVVFYLPKKPCHFQAAIDAVREARLNRLKGSPGSQNDPLLHKNDTVKIPYVKFSMLTKFTEQLKGKRYYAQEPEPWQISLAYQYTKFDLAEKGAKVRVYTGTSDGPFGGRPRKVRYVPRQFVFDRPFFVFLWKKDADYPYFASWIDGKDVLNIRPPKP